MPPIRIVHHQLEKVTFKEKMTTRSNTNRQSIPQERRYPQAGKPRSGFGHGRLATLGTIPRVVRRAGFNSRFRQCACCLGTDADRSPAAAANPANPLYAVKSPIGPQPPLHELFLRGNQTTPKPATRHGIFEPNANLRRQCSLASIPSAQPPPPPPPTPPPPPPVGGWGVGVLGLVLGVGGGVWWFGEGFFFLFFFCFFFVFFYPPPFLSY